MQVKFSRNVTRKCNQVATIININKKNHIKRELLSHTNRRGAFKHLRVSGRYTAKQACLFLWLVSLIAPFVPLTTVKKKVEMYKFTLFKCRR